MPKQSGLHKNVAITRQNERIIRFLLSERVPESGSLLKASNPWELLVAVILSAQCTDERVNSVTPALFARLPTAEATAQATQEELEELIRKVGLYRNKAAAVLGAARRITDVYGGEVPSSLDELLTLPGVGRKTANVVLFGAFGRNEGLAVDTHVGRIACRLGLCDSRDPARAEKILTNLFPREEWGNVNHRMVRFGREVCKARNPLCSSCGAASFCPKHGVALKQRR
ncbi:MAG: endonuclease III [Desulfovibrio sp.]|jgi:endonuclease-3|nr:endonuclease III [Desulfovibrio sp.]